VERKAGGHHRDIARRARNGGGELHLRQVLGTLGALVMGGEAYISFKPGLVDANGAIADETTRGFLKAFIDQFAATVARLSLAREAAA
jgi:chromate reductase